MGTPGLSRAVVVQVIKRAAEGLRADKPSADDPAAVARALAKACGELAVEPTQFDLAVDASADLGELRTTAIREALAGTTDPGPNAAVSREAATGRPGDVAQGAGAPGAEGSSV